MSNGGHQNSVATPSLWTRTALALALLLFLWTGWSLIAPSPRESPRSGALIARLDALQAAMEVLERESRQLGTRQTSAARWSQLFSAYRREAETLDLTDMDLGENADNLLRAYSYMSQAEEMRSSLLLSQFSEEHRRALEADFRTTIKLAITDVGSVIQGFRNTSAASEAGRRRALTRRLAVVCFLSCVLVAILLLQELKLVWRTRGKTRSLASPTWTDLLEKASFDGILTLDENALIRSFNPAAERIFGYSADEVVGQHLFQLIPSNSRTESDGWSLDERTAETASPEGFWLQVSGRRKDGATFPLDMRLFRVWDGLRFQFLGVFRDDSDRRRAMELSAECSLLGAVLELAAAPILVCDGEGRIVRFNRSCEDITGYSVDEVRSRRFWDFFWDAGVAEQARTAFASLDPESLPARMQQEWRTKDGGRQQIDWSLAALTGSDNAVEYVIAAGWPALERDAAGDEHSMEWARKLAGQVSLSFNHLLTAINGYADLLLDSVGPDRPLRKDLEEIRGAGERAAMLSGQLQAFSRAEQPQSKQLDLNELIRGYEGAIRSLLGGNIELTTELDAGPTVVEAAPAQLRQVLGILSANARDAMPGGGKLGIRTARAHRDPDGDLVVLELKDTGCGMSAETRSRLFEPFYTTKLPGRGLGLSLATVEGIISKSGGSIEVDSAPGTGTTFRIYLPQLGEPAEVEPHGAEARAASA